MQKIIDFHAEKTYKGLPYTKEDFDGVIVCAGDTPLNAYENCISDLIRYVGDITPISEMLDLDSSKFHNEIETDIYGIPVLCSSVAIHYKYAE